MAGPDELVRLSARLSRDLTERRIRHAVSGGAAMAAHGLVGASDRIEIRVVVSALRLPETFDLVRAHGFAGDDRELIDAIRDRAVATLRGAPYELELRLPVLPYDRTVVDRAQTIELNGVGVPIVALEDLIVIEALWGRDAVAGARDLVEAGGPRLDRAYVTATLASILPEDDARHAELRDLFARFGDGRS